MPIRFVSMALRFALPLLFPLLGCLAAGKAPAIPPELPVEDFFQEPNLSSLQFSPSGKLIAALMPYQKRMNLVIMDPATKSKKFITGFKDFGISRYSWGSDDRLLLLLDQDGSENLMAYGINVDGSHFDKFDEVYGILGRDPVNKGRVLVLAPKTHSNRVDPCSMDLRTGAMTVLAKNPGDVQDWVLDHDNVVRFGVASNRLTSTVYYRESNSQNWTTLQVVQDGEDGWLPLQFDADNRTLFVARRQGGRPLAIYKYDTATHTMGEKVFSDPTYDIDDVIVNGHTHRVLGVTVDADKPRQLWLDASYERRQQLIDQALPGCTNIQTPIGNDESLMLVSSRADREPGVYYLFDEKRRKIEEIAVTRPNLDPANLAEMKPFEYTARDGLLIHGYLTFPVGREPRNLPMVINPHGGPFGPRDSWRFNPEVQMLANRGFLVLQPNYRGSGGYGDSFERKGYRQWGRAMQDDLTDAVKWAIAQGYADPKRVVIMGASYGGYAVMAGLTFTPELYCAGINYVGATDLKLLARERRNPLNMRAWNKTRMGDLYEDAAELEARSPVNFAERVNVPLLMDYGRSDPRVTRGHGDDMAAALRKHGKAFEYQILSGEGHGYRKEENRVEFYRKVDAFLKRHVPDLDKSKVTVGTPAVVEMPAK